MKLDGAHLDWLIAEELQALFEQEMLDPNVGLAATQRAAETAKALKTDDKSKTTTTAPKTTPTPSYPGPGHQGRDAMRLGKRLADDPGYAWVDVPGGTRGGAPGYYSRKQKEEDVFGSLGSALAPYASATPIVGGIMTAKNVAADKEAGPGEKAVRYAAAAAQEIVPIKKVAAARPLVRGLKHAGYVSGGETIRRGGADPIDDWIKGAFQKLPGRKRSPEAEKKHQAQQKQMAAAQAGTDVGGGMTRQQLDTRNQQRLAWRAKKIGPEMIASMEKAGVKSPGALARADAHRAQLADRRATSKPMPQAPVHGRPGRLRRSTRAAAPAAPKKPVSEGIKSTMLTENQIKRFQKLANCKSPQKRLITEAIDPLTIISIILGALFAEQMSKGLSQAGADLAGVERIDDPWELAPGAHIIGLIWNKLKDVATSRSQKGDSSLESVLGTLESEAEGGAQQLSPEQIAMIQERFGDDEELAGLLAQLAEVEEEDYREVLSQVEQHIRSRLGK
jgi:hypothetical protein